MLTGVWDRHLTLRFLVVGTGCALLYFLICYALMATFGVVALVASAVAYLACFWVGYVLQRKVTFRSNRRHADTLVRYAVWHVFGAGAVSVMTSLVGEGFALSPFAVSAVSTGLCGVTSFFVSSRWVFGARSA